MLRGFKTDTKSKMTPEVRDRIREAVGLAGKALEEILVPTAAHPVRNPYAHIWREIKTEMGCSYSECTDTDEGKIMSVIVRCVAQPE